MINNQAAFVGQIARNDQERLALQRRSDEWQVKNDERWRKNEEWQRKSEARFENIEKRLARIEADLLQLPSTLSKSIIRTIFDQIPQIKKEIGFKTQK